VLMRFMAHQHKEANSAKNTNWIGNSLIRNKLHAMGLRMRMEVWGSGRMLNAYKYIFNIVF